MHKENPEQFTDPNHKPEIAVALGPFEVFAGFKETQEIRAVFDKVATLHQLLPGQTGGQWDNETLRGLCGNILEASEETVQECQEALAITSRELLPSQGYVLDLLPRLQKQYSKQDAGTLVALL